MVLSKDTKIALSVIFVVIIAVFVLKLAHNQENATSETLDTCVLNAKTYPDCMKCEAGFWCPNVMQCREIKKDAQGNLTSCN